ncbi:MAG: DUF3152 domain-containing protein [Actinomycetota bacterium]|nr:DUF3152 domain-containing protein [Actinomycetota bacterium]
MTQGERDAPSASSPSASADGDRYRRGARRTTAEPLEASWRPKPGESTGTRPKHRKGIGGILVNYGWRVYALPLLLAITVLVLARTAGDPAPGNTAATSGEPDAISSAESAPQTPEVTERPPGPVDINVPSAELPAGGEFPQAAAGTWHGVPGEGPKVGAGVKFFTYTVEIEDGIDPALFGGDDSFAKLIDQTLADSRGWPSLGQISVQRVAPDFKDPSFRVSLTTPDTTHKICGYSIKYESSCYRADVDKRVVINLARWMRGAVAFNGDMLGYRQYAINHEIGHAFRNSHVGCSTEGALAPVMMQQSFGVANNYVAQLNRAVGNSDAVKQDGLTCKPNAWPNPQGAPAG